MFGLLFLVAGCAAWSFVHPAGIAVTVAIWLAYQANQNFRIRAALNGWRPGPNDDPMKFAMDLIHADRRSTNRLFALSVCALFGVVAACAS